MEGGREGRREPELLSLETDEIQGFDHHDKADKFPIDLPVADADASDYDALVLPGGVINPDMLRTDPRAMDFVAAFFETGKPVASICHGPWSVETGMVAHGHPRGPACVRTSRTPAARGSTRRSSSTAGSVTSRKPDDLPAFCAKLVEEIAEGEHAEQREAAGAAG